MKISIVYDQNHNCLIGKFIGDLEAKHVNEYGQEILKMVKIHDCKRFLNDLREADIKLSITDLYFASIEAMMGEFNRTWKRALVVKKMTQEIEFYEITASNKGLNLKVFDNYDQALEWL